MPNTNPNKVYTPTEYIQLTHLDYDITDDITIEEFDILIADNEGLWNYCIEDESEIDGDYVTVKFNEGIRLVEIP